MYWIRTVSSIYKHITKIYLDRQFVVKTSKIHFLISMMQGFWHLRSLRWIWSQNIWATKNIILTYGAKEKPDDKEPELSNAILNSKCFPKLFNSKFRQTKQHLNDHSRTGKSCFLECLWVVAWKDNFRSLNAIAYNLNLAENMEDFI